MERNLSPILRDFRLFSPILTPLGVQNYKEVWEIPVQEDHDVVWTITLAYICSIVHSSDLSAGLKNLGMEVNKKSKEKVKSYNPFLYRTGYFNDQMLINTVESLKDSTWDFYEKQKKMFVADDVDYIDLLSSSHILMCNIIIIVEVQIGHCLKLYVNTLPGNASLSVEKRKLIILCRIKENGPSSFSYCISKNEGLLFQKEALRSILSKAALAEGQLKTVHVNAICNLPNITENFLTSIVNSELCELIPQIYKSPYIVSKLKDAKLQIDPFVEDGDGKSALFYALTKCCTELLYFLYNNASNLCIVTNKTTRSPDSTIHDNLLHLKVKLFEINKKLTGLHNERNCKEKLDGICSFNKFQISVCSQITRIRERIYYYDDDEKYIQALRHYETVLAILNSNLEFYEWRNSDERQTKINCFTEYFNHSAYFDNLDVFGAFLFFDNIFLLKDCLRLEDSTYRNVESQFFSFLYFKKYFSRFQEEDNNKYVDCLFKIIEFQERSFLQNKIVHFKNSLGRIEFKDNIIDNIPENEVKTLTNCPELLGEVVIFKLKHYLDVATAVKIRNPKSILVIERVLHVIGECLKDSDIGFKSVQMVLPLALPKKFTTNLKRIRDVLTHFENYHIPWRQNVENDVVLFENIQSELKSLKKFLGPVFSAHKCIMEQFVIRFSFKALNRILRKQDIDQLIGNVLSSEQDDGVPFKAASIIKEHSKNLYLSLGKQIKYLSTNNQIFTKNERTYNTILENIFDFIESILSDKNINQSKNKESIAKLDDSFWCAEWLLQYIITDKSLEKFRRKILKMTKYRCSFFREKKIECEDNNMKPFDNSLNNAYITYDVELITGFNLFEDDFYISDQKTSSVELFGNERSQTNLYSEEKTDANFLNEEIVGFDLFDDTNDSNSCHEETIIPKLYDDEIGDKETLDVNVVNEEIIDSENDSSKSKKEVIDFLNENFLKVDEVKRKKFNKLKKKDRVKIKKTVPDDNITFSNIFENSRELLKEYKAVAYDIFRSLPHASSVGIRSNNTFENLQMYREKLSGRVFLKGFEKKIILHSVPYKFQVINETINRLRSSSQKSIITIEQIKELPLSEAKKDKLVDCCKNHLKIEKCECLDSIKDCYSDLLNALEINEINETDYNNLCEIMKLPEEAKKLLSKIVKGKKKEIQFGNKLEFLKNRITILKQILIEDNPKIKELWNRAKSERSKSHVGKAISELYVRDAEVQAAVEMLLFDCMNLLKCKELWKLWKKANNLFSGIYLRNVLAHGNPLLESIGRFLDPYDLPSEFVMRIMRLIEDEELIDLMLKLIDISHADFGGFQKIMNDDESEHIALSKKIARFERWKTYSYLI